jgi:hypothetical protein
MIRKSVDNFISETKDIGKYTLINQFEEAAGIEEFEHVNQNQLPVNSQKYHGTFQRSASQKYNYRKSQMKDNETRFLHISPLNS